MFIRNSAPLGKWVKLVKSTKDHDSQWKNAQGYLLITVLSEVSREVALMPCTRWHLNSVCLPGNRLQRDIYFLWFWKMLPKHPIVSQWFTVEIQNKTSLVFLTMLYKTFLNLLQALALYKKDPSITYLFVCV